MKFIGRQAELAALERACGDGGGLAVVSGRRRVGKTALLDRFCRDRRAVLLPGTRAPVAEALRRLEERVRPVLEPRAGDLLDLGALDSWDRALGYLLARCDDEPTVLVLDELPYLCEADPSLPSTLQARWDHRGDSLLSVVLSGSHVGMVEQLLAADAPLFGRADAHLRLQPFTWRDVPAFHPGADPDRWLEAWVTVGGMPRYLALWDPRLGAADNLAALLDGPGAPMGDEGTVALQELDPRSAAARVLELVALGCERFGELRDAAGFAPATVAEALEHLERAGLVARLTPPEADPARTRRVRHRLRDPMLRLWLSLVAPHRDAFELGRGADVLTAHAADLAGCQQLAAEEVLADHLAERHGADAGPWWPPRGDRRPGWVLAARGGAPVAAGVARWADGVDGRGEAERLRAALADAGLGDVDEVVVLARGGRAVTRPADLYAAA